MREKAAKEVTVTHIADTRCVVSVSRRTDIPSFYGEWFLNRLREGRVQYRNPFGGGLYELSLEPARVAGFLFWSKNFIPFLPVLEQIKRMGYPFYCHFTITGLPTYLEPMVPSTDDAIAAMLSLSEQVCPEMLCWRFDPIILTDTISEVDTIIRFTRIARSLKSYVNRVYISFIDMYKKAQKNMGAISSLELSSERKQALAQQLMSIAHDCGMTLYACCEPDILDTGVAQAHCLDRKIINLLNPNDPIELESRPTRTGCGCYASRDIGAYDTCPAGCLYCYANAHPEIARNRYKNHDPKATRLI